MTPDRPEALLDLAMRLASEAGSIQRSRYRSGFRIESKSQPIDLVTEVDHACEAHIVETLARERPEDAILAEEGRGEDRAEARFRWVIDPLDGTTNFAHGYPHFAVSIGVEERDALLLGVVYDPMLDELYHAIAGGGAFLNGDRLHVSAEKQLDRSLVATGFSYDKAVSEDDNLAEVRVALKAVRDLRRGGSAALDLCYVAAGRLDGYWEHKLQRWDVAAGGLIVREAGGRVTDREAGEGWRSGRALVSSNGAIHDALLAVLAQTRA